MKANSKTKFVSEIDTPADTVTARKPFKVEQQDQRRFVRLEISSSMSLQKIKDAGGEFWPNGDDRIIQGVILNISEGGVLVDLNEAIMEGDVVCMRFTLQEVEPMDNILGLVKRSEPAAEGCLAGIEFLNLKRLHDLLTAGELDLLPGLDELHGRHALQLVPEVVADGRL